jgi:L-fuculose-phosphate aldolase
LVDVMGLLYERGLVGVRGGNASALVVLPEGTRFVYVTPSGAVKPRLKPEDIAVIGVDGYVYEGRPSVEYRLHLEVYNSVEGVRAVVHSHNPATVLLSYKGLSLDTRVLGVEARYYLGECVSRVGAYEPGSVELAKATASALKKCPVAVLEGHGAVAVGYNADPVEALYEALDRLEALEDIALASLWGQKL